MPYYFMWYMFPLLFPWEVPIMDPRLIQEASVLLKNISPVVSKEVIPRLTHKYGPVIAKKVGLPIAKRIGLPIARKIGIPIARKTGYFLMQKAGYPLINRVIGPESAALFGFTELAVKPVSKPDFPYSVTSSSPKKSFFKIPSLRFSLRKKKKSPSTKLEQPSPPDTFKPASYSSPSNPNNNPNSNRIINAPQKTLTESFYSSPKSVLPNNYAQKKNNQYYFGNTNPFSKGNQKYFPYRTENTFYKE